MTTYLLKQYHQSSPEFRAGRLIFQQAIEVENDDAAIAAAHILLRELGADQFIRLEDEVGRVVAYWGARA